MPRPITPTHGQNKKVTLYTLNSPTVLRGVCAADGGRNASDPAYSRAQGTVARSGQYGGGTQWVAVADIFGRAVLTYTDAARSTGAGVRINLAMPTAGPPPEAGGGAVTGQGRGAWHVATLETALRVCLASKTGISVAVHVNGNHWRALLPVDGEGRPRWR